MSVDEAQRFCFDRSLSVCTYPSPGGRERVSLRESHRERRVDDNLKGAHGAPEPDRQAPAAEHRLVPERGQRAAGELPHRPEVDAEGRPVEVVPAVRHAAEAADARVLVGGLAEPVAAHRRLGPEASSQRGPGGGAEASGHTGVWRGAREQVEVPGKG